MRTLPLAVMAVAVAFVLGGCSSRGLAADGPLSSGNSMHGPASRGSICAPGGQPWAFGLTAVGSYAVPGDRVVGVVSWPPRNPATQPEWKDRKSVHGFRLAAGKSFNMVLGVAAIAAGHRATSRGMLLYYHDSSDSYVAKDYWQIS